MNDVSLTTYEDTVKVSTVVYFVLGLIVPLWIVTLPLFWFLAYKSFKSGGGTPISKPQGRVIEHNIPSQSRLDDLAKLKQLHESGALNDEEFASEKAKILGN